MELNAKKGEMMKKGLIAGLVTVLAVFSIVLTVEAMPVAGIISSTNPAIYNSESHALGYKFTANNNVTITALGFFDAYRDGFSANHLVGLWDENQTLLSSVELYAGTGSILIDDFRYESMNNTVTLTAGKSYYIAGTTASDIWVYRADNIITDLNISYDGSYYALFTGYKLAFPKTTASDNQYITVNFLMDIAPVPEPATALLFGTGLAGLVSYRIRRKKK